MIYVLALIISGCLASAQALWGSAVKAIAAHHSHIGGIQLLLKMLATSKFWIGACLYGISTVVYFVLLSKARFFSVQLTMTGVAVIMSILIAHFFFHEQITSLNIVGVFFVLIGIIFVTH